MLFKYRQKYSLDEGLMESDMTAVTCDKHSLKKVILFQTSLRIFLVGSICIICRIQVCFLFGWFLDKVSISFEEL
jgi:hypothetical protein